MSNFSPLYGICRYIVMPSIRIFYKRIHIRNFENLPKEGAVFICSNHVNAFMDPVSLQLHTGRQIFSLARGDVFNKPFMSWLLTRWKIIPIYRQSEGAENLYKNEYSFSMSRNVLNTGNPLIIYPEAICVQERRIRKLKKGAARIAFDVEEQNNFEANLIILPLGMNYSEPSRFRSNLFMNFGEPIFTSKYNELYKQDKAKAINDLTAEIEREMKKLVINIQHKENDDLVEQLYVIYKPQLIREIGHDQNNLEHDFSVSDKIANAVNYFQEKEPQLVDDVKQKMENYTSVLSELDIADDLLSPQGSQTVNSGRILLDVLLSIAGMPLFLVALLMNYLPYKLGHRSASKLAKEIEFHASINMTIGWFSWIGYYLLQLLIVGLCFRNWTLLGAYAIAVPLTAWFALHFAPFLKRTGQRRRLLKLKRSDKDRFEELVAQRKKMFDMLDAAKEKYCQSIVNSQ